MSDNYSMDDLQIQVQDYPEYTAEFHRVSLQGDWAASTGMLKKVHPTVRKLSKEFYEVLKTGEVKEYKQSSGKGGKSLRQTMNRLEGLIRNNFTGGNEAQLFLTLTYKENMRDTKRLYADFDKFWKRVKYAFPDKQLEYLSVAEPQGRGAWHLHILVRDDANEKLYISNREIARLWGHGMTDTQRLKGDDVGKYYVTYFSYIQDKNEDIAEKNTRSKKLQKADRLRYYPKGFKFYRTSKGIKSPEIKTMHSEQLNELYPELKSRKAYAIIGNSISDNGEVKETLCNLIERQLRHK